MCEEAEGPKDRAMGDTAGDGGAKDRALGDTTGDGGAKDRAMGDKDRAMGDNAGDGGPQTFSAQSNQAAGIWPGAQSPAHVH